MNCREIRKQITAYLDDELSSSEKRLIQTHLKDCQNCQRELSELGALQTRMQEHLMAHAAAVAPSPQAWSTLNASLPEKPQGKALLDKIFGGFSLPRVSSTSLIPTQRAVIAILLLVTLVVVVPPVWARVETWISTHFSFTSPDGKSGGAIGGFTAFTPYHATYVPDGFQHSILGSTTSIEPEIESLELAYSLDEQFILLVQSKGAGVPNLPEGEAILVNTHQAIFIPSFVSSMQDLLEQRPTLPIDTGFAYEDTHLLTWFIDEVKIEMFSSLHKSEMLKVAESLEPMTAEQRESLFPFKE
jgi:hypothetical protein